MPDEVAVKDFNSTSKLQTDFPSRSHAKHVDCIQTP